MASDSLVDGIRIRELEVSLGDRGQLTSVVGETFTTRFRIHL
jgi:hypothetical protein